MMTNAQVDQTIKTYLNSDTKFVNKIDTLIVSHGQSTYTYRVGMRFGNHKITRIAGEWHDGHDRAEGLQHRDFHLLTGDTNTPNDMVMIGTVSGASVISVGYDVGGVS